MGTVLIGAIAVPIRVIDASGEDLPDLSLCLISLRTGLAVLDEEDRLLGMEVGANAYLTKGSFHDDSLVTTVADLIGGPE